MRHSDCQQVQRPKLVIVEGIMGAGKSSTAKYIDHFLREKGVATKLYLEGDLDHPADFEYVACLDQVEYERLFQKYGEHQGLLREIAVPHGTDQLIFYRREQLKRGERFPKTLYEDLARLDVYNGLNLHKHQELLLARWAQFAEQQIQQETTVIFECCLFQNPICKFLAGHNANERAVVDHVLRLMHLVESLDPVLIYLQQSEIQKTIERVSQERPKEWLDFVIGYHTEQEYGSVNDLHGLDGFLEFLQVRQSLELEMARQLPLRTLILDDAQSDWSQRLERLTAYLDEAFHLE